jgi:uncharacterized protein YbcC (UPF0753/DUF2309 family)
MIMYKENMTVRNNVKERTVINLDAKENNESFNNLDSIITESWAKISPFWSLKNLIAVNPLQGFEDLPIEEALVQGAAFFEQKEFPKPMELINRQTIKWLQAFFDEGQATIGMPLRTNGLYKAWKKLAYFDKQIHGGDRKKKKWLLGLSKSPEIAIRACFLKLNIPKESQSIFMTLMLTTLPGWASHIKYRTHWAEGESLHAHPVSEADYMAVRLIITSLLWEEAADIIEWHKKSKARQIKKISPIKVIEKTETEYLRPLLSKLKSQKIGESTVPDAQLIFCIDVRSEPFRRALESQGHYETFGFAGFFGIPVRIKNTITEELYASCPVLLKPQNTVNESPCSTQICIRDHKGYQKLNTLKALYQSLKYNFTTSFALVELLGFAAGFWMALRSLTPILAIKFRRSITEKIRPHVAVTPSLENISFSEQCVFAESALRAIGLTKNFSSLILFCGHGSATQNNAYATALDCGACGGRHGASNARILAKILNTQKVREYLNQAGIFIPKATHFLAAEHNTTADEVEIYFADTHGISFENKIQKLKDDLKAAGRINSQQRSKEMGFNADENKSAKHVKLRSIDWAQVRPEWGLARNASFIVAPREMTKNIDLEGRAFLHSYDYRQDPDGAILTLILTAPMVVAQWINSQYLFSTLDNVAYGSGSKITKNITGKIGIMQGNASDLMSGLPLQSVYSSDKEVYHETVRLMTIVYAPSRFIDKIIEKQSILQKLFRNGWVLLICIDPEKMHHHYFLDRDLIWRKKPNE